MIPIKGLEITGSLFSPARGFKVSSNCKDLKLLFRESTELLSKPSNSQWLENQLPNNV